jgi:hypothetical protein
LCVTGFTTAVREEFERLGNLADIDACVEAGAVWAFVQDPDNGERVSVLDAARQVPLAGYGDDGMGFGLRHPPSCKRAACCNGEMNVMFLREDDKILDLAFAAGLALVGITRNLNCAVVELQAVRHQEEDPFRLNVAAFGPDEEVVDLDEGLLYFL